MLCHDVDLFVIDPHGVREPHILPHPLHCLHITDRTLPKFLETELFFVLGLCEMGMKMHAIMARQLSGAPNFSNSWWKPGAAVSPAARGLIEA
jgi:hypothetical protein